MLHRLLFTCCLEIVLFSYNSQRTFPWILEVFPIEPFYFYRVIKQNYPQKDVFLYWLVSVEFQVIEVLIRAEDQLSRDVVKHLNHMEEQILESMAWRYESPLWEYLKNSEKPVPSCEEVSLPSQLGLGAPPTPSESAKVQSSQQPVVQPLQVPYSPSTYVSNRRAESSLAACKQHIIISSNFGSKPKN